MKAIVDVFHVGFPKTGTTWLQNELLPVVESFVCLGKPYSRGIKFRDWLINFVTESPLEFSADKAREEFIEILEQSKQIGDAGKIRIISYELLSAPLFNGYMLKEIAERIKKTFGDTRIVVTVRSQTTMLESLYRHYVRSGGSLGIRDFLYRRISPGVDYAGNKMLLRKLKYEPYIRFLIELFGEDNVKVLPMETMFQEPEKFAEEFFEFSGIDEPPPLPSFERKYNPSLSYFGVIIFRLINQIFSTPYSDSFLLRPFANLHRYFRKYIFTPIDRLLFRHFFPKRKFIDYRKYFPWERFAMLLFPKFQKKDRYWTIREEIENYYKESNRWTEEFSGQELGKFGYPI